MREEIDTHDATVAGIAARQRAAFTDRQLEEEPGRVVADVARALEQEDWLPMRQRRAKGSM